VEEDYQASVFNGRYVFSKDCVGVFLLENYPKVVIAAGCPEALNDYVK